MATIASNLFNKAKEEREREEVSLSARLTGDYATFWNYVVQSTGDPIKPSDIVRDSIKLMAFAARQVSSGQKIKTVFVDDGGERTEINDVVSFLKLSLPEAPVAAATNSDREESKAAAG